MLKTLTKTYNLNLSCLGNDRMFIICGLLITDLSCFYFLFWKMQLLEVIDRCFIAQYPIRQYMITDEQIANYEHVDCAYLVILHTKNLCALRREARIKMPLLV